MNYLALADLAAIAAEVLGGVTEDAMDVVDAKEAESALARAYERVRDPGGPPSVHETAAALLHELMTREVVPRGNASFAVLVMLQFLGVNGITPDLGSPPVVHQRLAAVRAGTTELSETVAWLSSCARPSREMYAERPAPPVPRRGGHDIDAAPSGLWKRLTDQSKRLEPDSTLKDLRRRLHRELISTFGSMLSEGRVSDAELRRRIADEVRQALSRENVPLSLLDADTLVRELIDDMVGYGPIDRHLRDPDVSEVMVNGPNDVYVERFGKLEKVDATFIDVAHLRRIIDKMVSEVGRRLDESKPMADARLPDGSRVNAVVHPLAIGGPFLTIRKFAEEPLTVEDLFETGTLSAPAFRFLDACVRGRLNTVVSGGTGTGKTTLLNVLSASIPRNERIIVIEDASELRLRQPHVLYLEARPANIEGAGAIEIRDLVRNALRMRPDRIVVGECRSAEAIDMLQAMNTGHDGSLTTVHSNGPRDTLARIETMTLMAGFDLPVLAIRAQMASALHLVVHLSRLRDGTRRITQITEVQGMEGDTVVLQDVFRFSWEAGLDRSGRHQGGLVPVGIRPNFGDLLRDRGVDLPTELL